jgi:serine/threonine protein phosphatase 1
MKVFTLGDAHGGHKALLQVLERSGFDRENDKLILLGDLVDGWSESMEVIIELMGLNTVFVVGNHDSWAIDFLNTGYAPPIWTSQGGYATMESILRYKDDKDLIASVREWMGKGVYYHVEDNRLFVHGGFDWKTPIEEQDGYDLTWDRHMWVTANMWHNNKNDKDRTMGNYDDVFIGHTTTSRIDPTLNPVHACNVWNLDQGAGWEGKLTLMNVETKEYWQSDIVSTLYPDDKGR